MKPINIKGEALTLPVAEVVEKSTKEHHNYFRAFKLYSHQGVMGFRNKSSVHRPRVTLIQMSTGWYIDGLKINGFRVYTILLKNYDFISSPELAPAPPLLIPLDLNEVALYFLHTHRSTPTFNMSREVAMTILDVEIDEFQADEIKNFLFGDNEESISREAGDTLHSSLLAIYSQLLDKYPDDFALGEERVSDIQPDARNVFSQIKRADFGLNHEFIILKNTMVAMIGKYLTLNNSNSTRKFTLLEYANMLSHISLEFDKLDGYDEDMYERGYNVHRSRTFTKIMKSLTKVASAIASRIGIPGVDVISDSPQLQYVKYRLSELASIVGSFFSVPYNVATEAMKQGITSFTTTLQHGLEAIKGSENFGTVIHSALRLSGQLLSTPLRIPTILLESRRTNRFVLVNPGAAVDGLKMDISKPTTNNVKEYIQAFPTDRRDEMIYTFFQYPVYADGRDNIPSSSLRCYNSDFCLYTSLDSVVYTPTRTAHEDLEAFYTDTTVRSRIKQNVLDDVPETYHISPTENVTRLKENYDLGGQFFDKKVYFAGAYGKLKKEHHTFQREHEIYGYEFAAHDVEMYGSKFSPWDELDDSTDQAPIGTNRLLTAVGLMPPDGHEFTDTLEYVPSIEHAKAARNSVLFAGIGLMVETAATLGKIGFDIYINSRMFGKEKKLKAAAKEALLEEKDKLHNEEWKKWKSLRSGKQTGMTKEQLRYGSDFHDDRIQVFKTNVSFQRQAYKDAKQSYKRQKGTSYRLGSNNIGSHISNAIPLVGPLTTFITSINYERRVASERSRASTAYYLIFGGRFHQYLRGLGRDIPETYSFYESDYTRYYQSQDDNVNAKEVAVAQLLVHGIHHFRQLLAKQHIVDTNILSKMWKPKAELNEDDTPALNTQPDIKTSGHTVPQTPTHITSEDPTQYGQKDHEQKLPDPVLTHDLVDFWRLPALEIGYTSSVTRKKRRRRKK